MRSSTRLQKGWSKLLENTREILGIRPRQVSPDVRQDVLSRLQAAVVIEKNRRVLPFRKIEIRLQPLKKSMVREFETAFMGVSSLKSDAYRVLKDTGVQCHPDLEISVELQREIPSGNKEFESAYLCEMKFGEPVDTVEYEIPEIVLEIIKGSAEKSLYRISKDRLLIGCLPEVRDREGRLVRINNIVFPDSGNEINATVSDMQARIWFDFKLREFRIMDESSLYGTRIVREGHTIEVPAENPLGVGLRSGDEVYFGQAGLRFRIAG